MKLFVLAVVLCSTIVVAFGATVEQAPVLSKEEEAIKYCNSSYPVFEDSRQKLTKIVINGETIPNPITFKDMEWCNLYCVLEKVGFFDAEGRMQVRKIYRYVLRFFPEIAPNSPTLLIQLYQVSRSIKGMEEKCTKAYVAYHRFTEAVMVANLLVDLDSNTDVKEKVIEAMQSEDVLPKEFEAKVGKYFKKIELFFKKTVENNANITITAAPVGSVPVA